MIPIIFRAIILHLTLKGFFSVKMSASQPFEILVTINNLPMSIWVPPCNVVIFEHLVIAHKFILMCPKDH